MRQKIIPEFKLLLKFQSTHPVWGATSPHSDFTTLTNISIHAPRVGCDAQEWGVRQSLRNFNPRTPCGVRPAQALASLPNSTNFNPRTPCGVRPTPFDKNGQIRPDFNPRTPCGVRPSWANTTLFRSNFNPRTPCGVRPPGRQRPVCSTGISIHAPRVGCDQSCNNHDYSLFVNFNPRTPCGVRLPSDHPSRFNFRGEFQSTHPVWGATLGACKL